MFVVRPVAIADLGALERLLSQTGVGLTSLSIDRETLRAKVETSLSSFEAEPRSVGPEEYLFVLEDEESGQLLGMSAIKAAIGLRDPYYSYRIGTVVHASKMLGVHQKFPALYLCNDYTECSELSSLFLGPARRGAHLGALISKARFLFIAQHPHRFSQKVIAEIRGFSTPEGRSPFWEGLGRHFFSIDFPQADYLVGTGNKSFIAELMPKHPIYVLFLPEDAQRVLGEAHPDSQAALHILEQEGFRYENYVDIFDAGPTVECRRDEIRTVRASRLFEARLLEQPDSTAKYLLANGGVSDFRCCVAEARVDDGGRIEIDPETANALRVSAGDPLRGISL